MYDYEQEKKEYQSKFKSYKDDIIEMLKLGCSNSHITIWLNENGDMDYFYTPSEVSRYIFNKNLRRFIPKEKLADCCSNCNSFNTIINLQEKVTPYCEIARHQIAKRVTTVPTWCPKHVPKEIPDKYKLKERYC